MSKILEFFKIKKYEDVQPHHHHISLLLVGKILLVVALIILIKPAFTGFSIAKQFRDLNTTASEALARQSQLNIDIGALQSRLQVCDEDKQKLRQDILLESDSKTDCLKEKAQLEIDMERDKKSYERDMAEKDAEIESEKKEIAERLNDELVKNTELEKNFNELAQNSANNICCKLKVDDKAIDSYSISGNRVVCGKGLIL
ncbi:hypothetical protein HYU10_03955 [Candidatus Woesearchaeota archaeon]|nr:hypothetical protein [Candidatus Woesearchaeota archaeon]